MVISLVKSLSNGWLETILANITVNKNPKMAIMFVLNLSNSPVAYSPVLDTVSLMNSATLYFNSK